MISKIKLQGGFINRRNIMTRLQKWAWINLGVTTVCVALAGCGVGLIFHLNAKGIVGLMAFLICGLIAGLISCLRSIANQAKLDEREKKIALRAFVISSYIFFLFFWCATFTTLFIVGGKGTVGAYTLPVLFLIGLFLSNFVQSAVILIQFARERADEQ